MATPPEATAEGFKKRLTNHFEDTDEGSKKRKATPSEVTAAGSEKKRTTPVETSEGSKKRMATPAVATADSEKRMTTPAETVDGSKNKMATPVETSEGSKKRMVIPGETAEGSKKRMATAAEVTTEVTASAVEAALAEEAAAHPNPPTGTSPPEKPQGRLSFASQDSNKSRRKSRTRSVSSRTSQFKGSRLMKKFKAFCGPGFRFIQMLCDYIQRMFTLPLVHDPVTFCRPEDFSNKGERIIGETDFMDDEDTMDMLEAVCNYSEDTRGRLIRLIEGRKEAAKRKELPTHSLDWSKLAPWNETAFNALQSTFQVFDISQDGAVDFDEMTSLMVEFGDKSSQEEREALWEVVDPDGKGILNFSDFVTMIHLVTVKSPEKFAPSIADTFRQIDRNMTRIRNLDVVQQLQAGLF